MIKISRGSVSRRSWPHEGHRRTAYQYSLTVTENGKTRRVRGQAPTRAEALEAMDAKREELRNATAPVEPGLTLGAAIDRVLDLKARKSAFTRRDYNWIARDLKLEFGAETPIVEITASRLAEDEGKRLAATRKIGKGEAAIERPLSLAALNRPRAFLRHVLRQAQEWGELVSVPKIRTPREQGRLRWLKPEEAVRLLDACRKSVNKVLADLVEFALFTGVRRSEALGLTWERVDRARGVILLELTKNGQRREVPLCGPADAVLARRWTPGATGYVFGGNNWNSHRTAWETALKVAGIENFRLHDLRHTAASWLVQAGRSLREVQEILGHKSLTMTMRYSHLAPEHLRAAVSALDNVLAAPAAPAAPVAVEEPVRA